MIPFNIQTIYQTNSRAVSPTLDYYNLASLADSAALHYRRAEITEGMVFSYHENAAYIHSGGLAQHRLLDCGAGAIRRQLSGAGGGGPVYLLWLYGQGRSCEAQPDYYGGL